MGQLRDAQQVWAQFAEQASDPATPAAGLQRLYFKTNGRLYSIDDGGTVTDLLTGAMVTFSPTGGISASTVQAAIAELDSEAEKVANKGVANGYASLDAGGKVPAAQIPVIAISETFAAADEAAMLALTAEVGDVAIRADEGDARYILAEAPATDVNNWIPLAHPADAVTSVAGKVGVVTLEAADLTDRDDVAVQDGTLSVGDLLVVKSLAPLVVEGVDSAAYAPAASVATNYAKTSVTSGDKTLNSTTVADVTGTDVTIDAAAGDVVMVGANLLWNSEAVQCQVDFYTIVGGSRTNPVGPGLASANGGIRGLMGESGAVVGKMGIFPYVVQAGDVVSGQVTFRLAYKTASANNKTLRATSANPLACWAINKG